MLLSVNAVLDKITGIRKRLVISGVWGLTRNRQRMPLGSREYCQRVIGLKVGGT